MVRGRRRPSYFDGLPDDVLRRIETSLNVHDRQAFFSCCRAARAYQTAAAGGLWPELAFELHSSEQVLALAAWLAPNRHHLGKLELTAGSLPLRTVQGIMAVLSALAGSPVHSLSLKLPTASLSVGNWVLCLPQLESLRLAASQLAMPADLSPLVRLTRLDLIYPRTEGLGEWDCTALPAGMPPHLRRLTLDRFDSGAFGRCVTAAGVLPELQGLTLWAPSGDWAEVLPWDWLPLRTALTSLALNWWRGLSAVPPQLEALTGLRQLGIRSCELPAREEALRPLSALTGLSSLDLSLNELFSIPACVFALPSLLELDASGNEGLTYQEPDIPLAGSTSLTKLSLSAELALGAARQLARFPALHTLWLDSDEEIYFVMSDEQEAVGRLLGELKRLPKFAVLDLSGVQAEEFREFLEFLQRVNLAYPYQVIQANDYNGN